MTWIAWVTSGRGHVFFSPVDSSESRSIEFSRGKTNKNALQLPSWLTCSKKHKQEVQNGVAYLCSQHTGSGSLRSAWAIS